MYGSNKLFSSMNLVFFFFLINHLVFEMLKNANHNSLEPKKTPSNVLSDQNPKGINLSFYDKPHWSSVGKFCI